jgi:hypothetical protein
MAEHDQRFKRLIQEFFPEFMTLFFPEQAALFDFSTTEWLDKEQLLDPPRGEVLNVDLLARLRLKGQPDADALAVVHVEVESPDGVAGMPERMFEYYQPLWRKYRRVLPVAVYLRVGFDGIGAGTHVERIGDFEVNRFQFLYVGFPGLNAAQYLNSNRLGVALTALMHMPRDRRAHNRADALRELGVKCQGNEAHFLVLKEVVEEYLTLDEEQQQVFEELLKTAPYQEVRPMIQNAYERAVAEGREKERTEAQLAIQNAYEKAVSEGERKLLRKQLEARFGALPPVALQRLEAWPPERLEELGVAAVTAPSLQALGLAD